MTQANAVTAAIPTPASLAGCSMFGGYVNVLTRRAFLKKCGLGLGAMSALSLCGGMSAARARSPQKGLIKTAPAEFSSKTAGGQVRCELCPRECVIPSGKRGFCRVRENRQGALISLAYGNPCAFHLDPIEKNPFFHVLPGSASLALATAGCNFDCRFCQTWEIAQAAPEEVYSFHCPPELAVERAKQMKARSVAYTYVEPVVFYEYMKDVGAQARRAGLLSLIHTNGFINPEPLRRLCPALDAANMDLKGFSEDYYHSLCGGELAPVLETLRILRRSGVHLEITNLVVPTRNDDFDVIRTMCGWIREELGSDTPVHFSRFYPLYKLRNLPPTPAATLEAARSTALSEGLKFVYIGNVPGNEAENTFCPRCGRLIIQRTGYMVGSVDLEAGRCRFCSQEIPGIWS